jgi:hypothetical protein
MRLTCMNHCRTIAALFLTVAAIGGCTPETGAPPDTLPRVAVAGTVTLDGAPLPEGTIQLDPLEGVKGATTLGEIVDGKYSIDRAGGPVPGKHKVKISSHAPVKLKEGEQPGGTPKLKPETVPAQYNTEWKLETDVPASGSSELDFALKKS